MMGWTAMRKSAVALPISLRAPAEESGEKEAFVGCRTAMNHIDRSMG
jgi:hypothetical protein